jgi:hypothetical protein
MSAIWTTVAVVAFLFPGVFFFIGLATYERLSREIIRSGVVSEIALATAVAVTLHLITLSLLSAFTDFRLSRFVTPLVDYSSSAAHERIAQIAGQASQAAVYFLGTAALGFFLGVLAAVGIVSGWLRFLAKHKWIYDVVDRDRKGGIVTAFVMTKSVENGNALMYSGRLHDIFLSPEGKVSYVTLKNCSRFFMSFSGDAPSTGPHQNLFDEKNPYKRIWDYLLIDGDNIANILFEPSATTIRASDAGLKALQEEMSRRRERLEKLRAQAAESASDRHANGPKIV